MSNADFLKTLITLKKPIARLSLMLVLFSLALSASALDLTLNGRNHAILDSDHLDAFARGSVIPLQALFPWLESVDYLEVQSGVNQVYWEASRLGDAAWNGALLVKKDGLWEIRVGRDVFSDPDRIAVKGVRRDIDSISIWSSVGDSGIKADLAAAFALRAVNMVWRDVPRPDYLLSDPPSEGLPHLVLLDQLDVLRLDSLLTSSRPVSYRASTWRGNADIGLPLAMDAYNPEAALCYLLAENAELFDEEGRLPSALSGLFDWAAASRKWDLVVTDMPMSALSAGFAETAVRLPSSGEPWSASESGWDLINPPEGTVNIARFSFASIPAGVDGTTRIVAELAMADAARMAGSASTGAAVPIPMDLRVYRFFEAYDRIGRLAVMGQLDGIQAATLINEYVNESVNE